MRGPCSNLDVEQNPACLPACISLPFQAWVDAFFAPGLSGMRFPGRQVQVVEPPVYSILSRTNSTIHVTFTYDEDIRFQGPAGI